MRIGALPNVLPVEHVLAELCVPARRGGAQVRVSKAVGRRIRQGEKGGSLVVRIARPPADSDLLGIPSVANDEVVRRWIGGPSREEADREIEGAPPGIDGCRASPKRRPAFRQNERRMGGSLKVDRH